MLVRKYWDVVILVTDLKMKKIVCLASIKNALKNVLISMELMVINTVQFATSKLSQHHRVFVVVVGIYST
jgi:hypothetical protein